MERQTDRQTGRQMDRQKKAEMDRSMDRDIWSCLKQLNTASDHINNKIIVDQPVYRPTKGRTLAFPKHKDNHKYLINFL